MSWNGSVNIYLVLIILASVMLIGVNGLELELFQITVTAEQIQSEEFKEEGEIEAQIQNMKQHDKAIVIFDPPWSVFSKKYRTYDLLQRYYLKIQTQLQNNQLKKQNKTKQITERKEDETRKVQIYRIQFHDWYTHNDMIDQWFVLQTQNESEEMFFKYGGKLSWPRICLVQSGSIIGQFQPCSQYLNMLLGDIKDWNGSKDNDKWKEEVELDVIPQNTTNELFLSDDLLLYTYSFLFNFANINHVAVEGDSGCFNDEEWVNSGNVVKNLLLIGCALKSLN